jgi:eukaryotic translation initiation factor 2C
MLPEKNAINASRHAAFKAAADQMVGIKSAVMCEQNLAKNSKNLAPYMGNLAMKLNMRLGNTNHEIAPGDLHPLDASESGVNCMMLGADVTHPGAGSSMGARSIAAVVGSMDYRFTVFQGQMRLQEARQERIHDMKDMVRKLLEQWADKHKKMPKNLLLYRDGVSESQYDMVKDNEVYEMREGWRALYKQREKKDAPSDLPKITAVVLAKRHHTRFYAQNAAQQIDPKPPKSGKKGNENCWPGTIVDSGITSPYYMDFFLQSHSPIIGTGRPAHYFVVQNGMNFSAHDLQNLTNKICYLYGRSTSPVSYATPAYYADRLCERGRQYLRPMLEGETNIQTEEAGNREVQANWWRTGNGSIDQHANPWHSDLDHTMFWM